ncbi:hypothetical protein DUNSADRAFT_12655 [Dunaliella salina]|uniref:Encoded protein n=1 Tax=Dunaliella salina TaxID=3046 RepID=A0ABQ7H3R7_DUNSA|nr:hypothetical protein DUNSADRAFT_12655 [Dunaliella salina]|eukprot:KAF5841490.1 hypothetical protein DUNSADRAFT_12655 [Dunaliella salina]
MPVPSLSSTQRPLKGTQSDKQLTMLHIRTWPPERKFTVLEGVALPSQGRRTAPGLSTARMRGSSLRGGRKFVDLGHGSYCLFQGFHGDAILVTIVQHGMGRHRENMPCGAAAAVLHGGVREAAHYPQASPPGDRGCAHARQRCMQGVQICGPWPWVLLPAPGLPRRCHLCDHHATRCGAPPGAHAMRGRGSSAARRTCSCHHHRCPQYGTSIQFGCWRSHTPNQIKF